MHTALLSGRTALESYFSCTSLTAGSGEGEQADGGKCGAQHELGATCCRAARVSPQATRQERATDMHITLLSGLVGPVSM